MSEFKPLRSFEDRFTVKKTLEFGGCKLYAGVVRLNLDEKLLEASRVEFAREQAAAFVVAPNHLTDLTMLADEGHEVTALGNGGFRAGIRQWWPDAKSRHADQWGQRRW